MLRYRVNNRLRRLTLGPYPDLSLHDARRKAREVLGDVARGDDPAQDKQQGRDAETFRGLVREYLEMAQKRHRSWKEEERIAKKDLLPDFGHRLLVDIRRRDVRDLVEAIARKRSAPIMANRTLRLLSQMFNYALDREWIEANPAARIPDPGEERARERVLSNDELRELWTALAGLADQGKEENAETVRELRQSKAWVTEATAQAFQVQLLTAQRPGEIAKVLNHVEGGACGHSRLRPLRLRRREAAGARALGAAVDGYYWGQDRQGRRHAGALIGESDARR